MHLPSINARPRRMLAALATLSLAALTTLPTAAAAQSAQRYSVQASGIFVGTFGEAYDGLKSGVGLEAQFRITPSAWSYGFGLQGSSHKFDDATLGEETVTLSGIFFEPRRVLDVGSSQFAPYLSARLAFLQQSLDLDVNGTAVSASASGAQVNGGGGVLIRLSPKVNLDLGATYGLIKFSDVEVDIAGVGKTKVEGSSGNGSNLVLRAGLAIGIK
ncbi:MAG: outer membrane beta-barrel protein [Gemmatimonadaceae bacterium]|nr:outer membrane beta-barrel protein [Gemmatimonadaceae bacterium]